MITSRAQLHAKMEKTIDKNLRSISERGEQPDYAVKTNIIEANCSVGNIPNSFSTYNINLKKTKDKFLYILIVREKNEKFELYLDSYFKRFWKIYNIQKSQLINRFMHHFTSKLLKIDSLWMPHQMLDNFEKDKDYSSTGFSIKFKQEVLSEEELSEEDISQLSMRLWSKGSNPARRIVELLKENQYPVAKTSTRLLYIKNGEVKFLDEVHHDGQVTISRGTDIEEHIRFVDSIIDAYTEKMTRIENNRMGLEPSNGGFISSGHPFELKFSKPQNIETFSEKIVNSTRPFRLWGIIHDHDKDFLRISGVDTHTGDKFDMDVMPEYVRVYLPKKACGNMIFRLYTNIQHSLDPGVTISDQHGPIF
ncbi:MAG: hypothetical protein PVF58_19145 [Candidatus Methanofastidiosia archaeon]